MAVSPIDVWPEVWVMNDKEFNRTYQQPAVKAAKLRARIGGSPALLKPLPEKPKYMHQETYDSICYRILAHELAAVNELKRYNAERWLPILLKLDELAAEQQLVSSKYGY